MRFWDRESRRSLALLDIGSEIYDAEFDDKTGDLIVQAEEQVQVWRQLRPMNWWGHIVLPQFWVASMFATLLIVSLLHDRRMRSRS